MREEATDLSRPLTASHSPRATPSWHRVLLSTSFGASLTVIPCWTSPLHGEAGGKFGNKGEERQKGGRDREREGEGKRGRVRERKGDRRCGDREEGREREKVGWEKRGGRRLEGEKGSSEISKYKNSDLLLTNSDLLLTNSDTSVAAIRSQRYCTACTQSKTYLTCIQKRKDTVPEQVRKIEGVHEYPKRSSRFVRCLIPSLREMGNQIHTFTAHKQRCNYKRLTFRFSHHWSTISSLLYSVHTEQDIGRDIVNMHSEEEGHCTGAS